MDLGPSFASRGGNSSSETLRRDPRRSLFGARRFDYGEKQIKKGNLRGFAVGDVDCILGRIVVTPATQ
jgi:hypothetical protein